MWASTPGLASPGGRVVLLTSMSFGSGLLLDAWNRAAYMAHLQGRRMPWQAKGADSGCLNRALEPASTPASRTPGGVRLSVAS